MSIFPFILVLNCPNIFRFLPRFDSDVLSRKKILLPKGFPLRLIDVDIIPWHLTCMLEAAASMNNTFPMSFLFPSESILFMSYTCTLFVFFLVFVLHSRPHWFLSTFKTFLQVLVISSWTGILLVISSWTTLTHAFAWTLRASALALLCQHFYDLHTSAIQTVASLLRSWRAVAIFILRLGLEIFSVLDL